jgi:hypothetical protein
MEVDLWQNWLIFQENSAMQIKKQGYHYPHEKYQEFSSRGSSNAPPSFQTFYESIINGIMLRQEKNLYRGKPNNHRTFPLLLRTPILLQRILQNLPR